MAVASVVTMIGGAVAGVTIRGNKASYDPYEAGPAAGAVVVTTKDLDALLARHTKALNDGDAKAYTSIFDQKNAALVQRQATTFANLRKLPLTEMSYQTMQQRGPTQDSFGRAVTFTLDVAFVHRFEGIDLGPVSEWYRWTVTKSGAKAPLTVTKVGGAPAPIGESETVYYPGPWDIWPDIAFTKTEHAIVMAHPSLAAQARRLAPVAERTAVDNLAYLGEHGPPATAVPKGFVVALVKGATQLGNLFRKAKATESGVSIPMPVWKKDGNGGKDELAIGGSRVVLDLTAPFFTTTAGSQEIFRHEFAHSMVASLEKGRMVSFLGLDNWIVEGFAEYVANRGRPISANVRYDSGRAYLAGRLPFQFRDDIPSNFDWEAEGMGSVNYLMGHLAIRMIAEKYGERKMLAFVVAHYQGESSADALRKEVGVDMADFRPKWADYVRRQLG
ncbi:hypothetical protein [Sphaerisporangium sp. TRM90804]|uniref:hypothetical protein n=1 Tax=Sphaerisporangium sp. TRM90804 TaxID=3031113 RepID=UPI0024489ADF|nr:hypothetical protein [Sphaerisporangium sp. TRM90804]MDH2428503.1 hypothetical protein [Sphaerisporangium sp. TRM90804]